jgi:hypothetical protein
MMDHNLTVIVQTSPIPSHPSTALLEALFRSFHKADGLLESRIVILADGCEEIVVPSLSSTTTTPENDNGTTAAVEVENIKHGKSSSETAENYRRHLEALKSLVQNQVPPFCPQGGGSIELFQLETRHGSAPAIRAAMERVVTTPLVSRRSMETILAGSRGTMCGI